MAIFPRICNALISRRFWIVDEDFKTPTFWSNQRWAYSKVPNKREGRSLLILAFWKTPTPYSDPPDYKTLVIYIIFLGNVWKIDSSAPYIELPCL